MADGSPFFHTVAYTTTGTKASQNLDSAIAPFQVTVACTVGTTATYKLQYSLDPMDVADASAIWFDSTGIPASSTTSLVTSFVSPVARVRLIIGAVSGTLTMQIRQGISIN
ncbi:MAG: hypothetical protein KGL39_06420 [Patescibacteria group bacterium]|nr:hypothetical protein [Patescibacteria group bacterium]